MYHSREVSCVDSPTGPANTPIGPAKSPAGFRLTYGHEYHCSIKESMTPLSISFLLPENMFQPQTSTSMETELDTTDVIICGCGPTGAMLSAFLGKANVSNVVLEKESEITADPRGITLDDDGIRFIQGLGLYKAAFTDIGTCKFTSSRDTKTKLLMQPLIGIPGVRFVSGDHTDLLRKEFLYFDTGSVSCLFH